MTPTRTRSFRDSGVLKIGDIVQAAHIRHVEQLQARIDWLESHVQERQNIISRLADENVELKIRLAHMKIALGSRGDVSR